MKQRIRTVALIQKEGELLLMKRRNNRLDMPVFWELPTGKIEFGEQPEEAMARIIYDYLGVQVKNVILKDVVTFLALEGSSQLANLYIIYTVELDAHAKISPSERYSAYKFIKREDVGQLRLDEASLAVLGFGDNRDDEVKNYRGTANGATVYIDGASRGNPGPAGIGYYIVGEDGRTIKKGGEFIGFATSRIAEYYALKTGIEQAIALGLKSVRFVGDNLMMINHMNGIYRIKNRDLLPIYEDIQKLLKNNFEAVSFLHVKRELNREADQEAGKAIDRHFGGNGVK